MEIAGNERESAASVRRQCLLQPPRELDLAAKLLDAAADALLSGRRQLARELVAQSASFPEILDYVCKLVGPMTKDVHRWVGIPKSDTSAKAGMPPRAVELQVYNDDGWRCRFCGIRVVSREARSVLSRAFELGSEWTSNAKQKHSALYAMGSSLDHILPRSRRGDNERANLVTACYGCQFGRGSCTLEEVELTDPRERPAVRDSWDGLTRLLRKATT
jgi:hypothetical protein